MQSSTITGYWRLCRALLLLLVTGDCAEHSYYYWLLDCAEQYYYYWLLETVPSPAAAGYWRLYCAEHYYYDWGLARLCRALLLLVTGDCAEHSYSYWLLDCAEQYYYYWLLETVQSPAAAGYWRLYCAEHYYYDWGLCAEHYYYWLLETVQSTPIITGY